MQSEFTITTTLPANVQADINNATDEQRQAFRDALDVHDEAARLYGEGSPRTKAASRRALDALPASIRAMSELGRIELGAMAAMPMNRKERRAMARARKKGAA